MACTIHCLPPLESMDDQLVGPVLQFVALADSMGQLDAKIMGMWMFNPKPVVQSAISMNI